MTGWIQRVPARTHDMPGMKNSSRETVSARFSQQIFFNRRLLYSVVPEWTSRLFFGSGNNHAGSVNPNSTTMKKMLDLATKRFDQMLSARRGKADQVNHHVRSQIGDLSAERSRSLIFLAIDFYSLSRSPRSVHWIRLTLPDADRDQLAPSRPQSQH